MSYFIKAFDNIKINLAPQTIEEEVLQNISTIISTPKFSVPLDRNFGLSQLFVDRPIPVAKQLIISEIYDAIEKYEPRAIIKNIGFIEKNDGKLVPRVEVSVINE